MRRTSERTLLRAGWDVAPDADRAGGVLDSQPMRAHPRSHGGVVENASQVGKQVSARQNVKSVDVATQASGLPGIEASVHTNVEDATPSPPSNEMVDGKGDLLVATKTTIGRDEVARRGPTLVKKR